LDLQKSRKLGNKMKKTKKMIITTWIVLLVMAINLFPFGLVYAANINPDVLTNLSATVTQDGVSIPDDGTITSTMPIRVEISFGVPVEGDDPTPSTPVQQGDTVTFELSDAFTVPTGASIELKMGTLLVGHATFATDPVTSMVTATVVFDGDASVFNGDSNTVTCQFGANFEYDGNGSDGDAGDHLVAILDKTYTVNVPEIPIEYNVTKTGTADLANQSIEWSVTIEATQGSVAIDLEDYNFYDDLQSVGEYLDASFKVDGTSVSPVYDSVDNTLGYVFPEDSTSPKVITFKTEIPDSKFYATTEQTVTNNAQLLDSESTVVDDGQYEVKFTPNWIEKSGVSSDAGSSGIYDPTNRTITWTITANHMGATLNDVVITDVLPSGLTLQSATWQTWTGTAWDTATSITPTAGEYAIGNINSMILLTIVTNVPDETYTAKITTYTNSASIKWLGSTGYSLGSGNIAVEVGYNAISKSGVTDPANQKVRWTVNVDTRQQSIPSLKVYDLLVYGTSINLSTVTGIPSGIATTDLTPRFGQKYAGNFDGSFTVNVIPIFQGTTRVADLLEITGLSTTAVNTFRFDSQVVNPNIFAGNKTSTVSNTATLFSANAKLNAATANVSYINRMLQKRLLNRQAIPNPAAGVNSWLTSDASLGFDYQEKSAIFRLSINADGIDVTNAINAAGQALGVATVTDTLPEGWEFVEIIDGSNYLAFEGTGQSNGNVVANDTTPDTVTGLTADFSGRIATFTFDSLDSPYVILVKAKPTDETNAAYFSVNQTITERNDVSLKTENWSTGVSSYQNVGITSRILDKTTTQPTAGELLWTVEYKPYDLAQTGYKLEDQLPIGIDLRMDSSGQLILDGNISANEMTLNANGSYTLGGLVTLELGVNIIYNNATRVLSFIFPDNTKAYRFSYLTDITGEPGTITNQVSLLGSSTNQEDTSKPYTISASDGSASLLKNGWISITKNDDSGTPLAGAEFTLFAIDGTTVIKQGITGADGTLKLKVIPDGEYILRETMAPEGFALEGVDHSLVVTTSGSTVTSSLDEQTGVSANEITVQNFSEGTVGNLRVTKTVEGEGADATKQFVFTLTLVGITDTFNYIGAGTPSGTIASGDTFSLSHGQSITIVGIPKGTMYSVVETDYSGAGYTTTSTDAIGSIVLDETQMASFVNDYSAAGTLAIAAHKTISGRLLVNSEFSFAWQQIDPLSGNSIGETVIAKNASTGDVFFPAIHYAAADDGKDFTYKIKEVNNKVRTIRYDQSEYQVKVHITDLGDGSLKVDKTIYKVDAEGNLVEVDAILFHNEYDKSLEEFPNDEGADTGDPREMYFLGFLAIIGLLGMGYSFSRKQEQL
jgi:pilin isopeptide linkage protein/uncharacterized repeat protein (TIGR01451 family)